MILTITNFKSKSVAGRRSTLLSLFIARGDLAQAISTLDSVHADVKPQILLFFLNSLFPILKSRLEQKLTLVLLHPFRSPYNYIKQVCIFTSNCGLEIKFCICWCHASSFIYIRTDGSRWMTLALAMYCTRKYLPQKTIKRYMALKLCRWKMKHNNSFLSVLKICASVIVNRLLHKIEKSDIIVLYNYHFIQRWEFLLHLDICIEVKIFIYYMRKLSFF